MKTLSKQVELTENNNNVRYDYYDIDGKTFIEVWEWCGCCSCYQDNIREYWA